MVVGDTFIHASKVWRIIPAPGAGEYWPDDQMVFRARLNHLYPWIGWLPWGRSGKPSSGIGVSPDRQYAVLVGDVPRYDREFPEDE